MHKIIRTIESIILDQYSIVIVVSYVMLGEDFTPNFSRF